MSDDGSDDSTPRPKRKIKRLVVLASSASSDSDESIGPTGTRRKRMRVVSDAESESSGSSVGARRKRLPKLRDSDGDSDTSGWATDHSDAPKPAAAPAPAKPTSGFASDSSEGNSDKCSICLMRFTTQLVGTPQSCEHIFCLDCITEWSKNVNTCPVDRMTFESIVVRACAGGRVLRTEPVKVVERRPSVEMLVVEDPTICEICGSAENEETMLLCDGCDLGFHMQCLTPPLTEIPADQWLCPNCDNILDVIHLSEVEDLFTGLVDIDLPHGPRPAPLREPRNVRRSSRNQNSLDEPSTSSGRRGTTANVEVAPSTSRGSSTSHRTSTRSATTRRRTAGTQRRKYKRRRTKTVIIEYELEENGKFPVTKRVKRRVKKRRVKKRQPRTVARRSHVRASVRAKLASLRPADARPAADAAAAAAAAGGGVAALAQSRRRAGIPALSLFGSRHQLDYFSEDDEVGGSEGASVAVAARPAASVLSSYRQVRRKMVTIPSPPHASSAPDLLSSILDSQSKLHSKNSIVSISVDGNVNIKLQTRNEDKSLSRTVEPKKDDKKLDLTRGEDAARKAPSYPGQSRGGGWGGGYRGNYHREQGGGNFNRGGGYAGDGNRNGGGGYGDGGGGGGGGGYGYQSRQQGGNFNSNMRRDDAEGFGNYPRRQYPYPQNEDNNFDRNRRPQDSNRPQNFPPNQRPTDQGRHSLGPSWQPYGGAAPAGPRRDGPQMRHSFGSENPLDMRMGQVPLQNNQTTDAYAADKPQPYRPLPEPPLFKFDKTPEVEKSEDERSDSGLVIDTEKYDPTEPTNDDDSGDDAANVASSGTPDVEAASPPVASVPAADAAPAAAPAAAVVQNILAGLDAGALNVPANVLDSAVRQVLQEHRDLIAPAAAPARARADSDDDSDGDCPNFSIYSATSVHIANDTGAVAEAPAQQLGDDMADLVQEDDETPPRETDADAVDRTPVVTPVKHSYAYEAKKKSEEELKEKVSKRCPITTNPRNPIKIKLNTPSLIKRHVPLYDEEEELVDEAEPEPEPEAETKPDSSDDSPKEANNLKKKSIENLNDVQAEPSEPIGTDRVKSGDPEESKDDEDKAPDEKDPTDEAVPEKEEAPIEDVAAAHDEDEEDEGDDDKTPKTPDAEETKDEEPEEPEVDEKEQDQRSDSSGSDRDDKLEELASDEEGSDTAPPARPRAAKHDGIEKMTESISETEDERSYTPCLDENKSKDTSLETDKDKGIEGLDTEMISEDEGNEMFSEEERQAARSPPRPAPPPEEGEILDKRKEKPERDEPKKKKRKESKRDSKKEGKDKKRKRGEVAFKKLSKSGKERNYRDKDKEERPRRDSSDGERKRKRKEKRKDLERYDVRTVVSEKRRRAKDPFGRDVSPRRSRSASASRSPARSASAASPPRARRRRSSSRPRRTPSPRPEPARLRRSASRARPEPEPRPRASASPRSPSPARRRRRSASRPRRRRSGSRGRKRRRSASRSGSPRDKSKGKRRRRARSERAGERRAERRRSPKRRRARRRSAAREPAPVPPAGHGGAWSPLSVDSRLLSPRTPPPEPSPPPPALALADEEPRTPRRRRDHLPRHRRVPPPGPSKEVFTSGDNILVSVSFKEQERARGSPERRERRERRRRRRRRPAPAPPAPDHARPVAIIDLERSPFRELTPSPRNVIVLSDSEHAEPAPAPAAAAPAAPHPAPPQQQHPPHAPHAQHPPETTHHPAPATTNGPRTPPSRSPAPPAAATAAATTAPAAAEAAAATAETETAAADARGPNTPPEPPSSPDAYDPFEPTRSASNSPASASPPPAAPRDASPPRPSITLETAQKTNLSADDVIDRRPLSPMEKVMALLASTRDVSPEPPPGEASPAPAAPRIVLPDAPRHHPPKGYATALARAGAPKLFLAKPSPIKSDPIKPMQQRPAESPYSPYSPGESDFGDLFEPPARHKRDIFDALVDRRRPKHAKGGKLPRKKGNKTQVGVKIDDDNLKILDELPNSAVEMQVKSKYLKKLNRQERVVEEVKLVLKPHYNKKHVTKDEYKDILRRAVPKICHNKSGEINPTKIQALVEAYVKKFRKKHKLGLA